MNTGDYGWVDWDAIHSILNFWIAVGVFFAPIVGVVLAALLGIGIFVGIVSLIDRFFK